MTKKTKPRLVAEEPEAPIFDARQIRLDPLGVNAELYYQGAEMLRLLRTDPHLTARERIAIFLAVARVQVMFVGLRKEKLDEPSAGATVRKYAAAFKAHDSRGRKAIAGPEPDDELDAAIADAVGDDDDDDAA